MPILVFFVVVFASINIGIVGYSYAKAVAWLNNDDHRLPNIRALAAECRAPFIRKFIALQDWSKPTLAVFGDSQPFNSGVPQENTWPYLFNREAGLGLDIVNLAVIDGRLEDTQFIASEVRGKAALSILNINQSHFSGRSAKRVQQVQRYAFEFEWCAFAMRKYLATAALPLPADIKARERYRKLDLPPDRYDMEIDLGTVQSAIDAVSAAATDTIVFTTPNNTDVFYSYGYDAAWFGEKSAELNSLCVEREVAHCFDLALSLRMENFIDIVHLNTAGNKAFAEILGQAISKQR